MQLLAVIEEEEESLNSSLSLMYGVMDPFFFIAGKESSVPKSVGIH